MPLLGVPLWCGQPLQRSDERIGEIRDQRRMSVMFRRRSPQQARPSDRMKLNHVGVDTRGRTIKIVAVTE